VKQRVRRMIRAQRTDPLLWLGRVILWPRPITSSAASCNWRLVLSICWSLPLTDTADVDVLGLERDQRNAANLKPHSTLSCNDLCVVASWANVTFRKRGTDMKR